MKVTIRVFSTEKCLDDFEENAPDVYELAISDINCWVYSCHQVEVGLLRGRGLIIQDEWTELVEVDSGV